MYSRKLMYGGVSAVFEISILRSCRGHALGVSLYEMWPYLIDHGHIVGCNPVEFVSDSLYTMAGHLDESLGVHYHC